MALLSRRRILLAKIETTYGVDSSPVAANAMLIRNMDITPLDSEIVSRDLVRPYFGNYDQIIAAQKVGLSFEVELQSSGTAGVAPAYGPLLRACGLAETVTAAAVTGSAQAGSVSTITLAVGASAVTNLYVGLPVSITSGTGAGSSSTIVAYDGATKIATVSPNFATAPAASSAYSIGPGVAYRPISSAFESVTMYAQLQDSVQSSSPLHKILGARGNVEFTVNAKSLPVAKFTMTGVYSAVVDSTNLSATYTGFRTPTAVNKGNTPSFSFFGLAAVMSEFSVNLNNEVVHRNLVNSESVILTDRKAAGTTVFEAPTISTGTYAKDFFATALGTTNGSMSLVHGATAGSIVDISAYTTVDIQNPTYSDMDGIVMMSLPFVLIPTTLGNDEFYFTAR